MELKQINALLIEDNPADARLIREILSDVKGLSLHLVCSDRISTGMKRFHQGPIDVILLDLSLPDSQGSTPSPAFRRRRPAFRSSSSAA